MKNLFHATLTVKQILRIRPLAIEVLEKHKLRFWDSLELPLEELCKQFHVSTDLVLQQLEALDFLEENSDWIALPLYALCDHLTQNHRDFFLSEIHDLQHTFDIHTLLDTEETQELRKIFKEFQAFCTMLKNYFDEEEVVLLPKILRQQACLQNNNIHPEFHSGSVKSIIMTRCSPHEKKALDDLLVFLKKIQHPSLKNSDSANEIRSILARLVQKLQRHIDLETNILFPQAQETEKQLFDLSIGGQNKKARNTGLDSGVMRLMVS